MAMATALSSSLLHSLPVDRRAITAGDISPPSPSPLRRRSLSLLLLSSPAISALSFAAPSKAQDIPIFGLRKKLEKAEEIVKEGEQAIEKEIQAAEQGIEAAEGGLGLAFGVSGDLFQAAAVAGAEAVGVLVGVSVVKGILGPESKKL